jgi:ABC-2 type transport system permease protein
VASTQLLLMWRERRLLWFTLAVVLLAGASLVSNAARLALQAQERQAATEQEARLWHDQGIIDPHDAAHVGRAVHSPVRPLAAFDPGISDFVGSSVFIEGHVQNPARYRPIEGGAALSRFTGFSAAWTLQVVAPLMIILAGFATMSGELARARLRQELGAGASTTALVAGRLMALVAMAGLLMVLMIGATMPAILLQDVSEADVKAFAALSAGYVLYLFVFCALTVAVSGLFVSARTTLVVLLGFWAFATVLLPRVAPAVAETLAPTPSAVAFKSALIEDAEKDVDVHDPKDQGLKAFKAGLLANYGVSDVADLPINFRGAKYEYGEKLSTERNRRHFDQLYKVYRRQDRVQRMFALLSPTISVKPWSRAFASTGFGAHLSYLRGVEDYRFRLMQKLNVEIKHHKPQSGERHYATEIASITRDVIYRPGELSLYDVAKAQAPNLAILLVWAVLAIGLTGVSAQRLGQRW